MALSDEKITEYKKLVIKGFNDIATDPRSTKRDKNRAEFLLGCIYGYEKYIDEDYNPKAAVYSQRRRSRERLLESSLDWIEWKETLEYFDHSCVYCGKINIHLAQDHFIPVMSNGGYIKKNIIPACSSCNSSKRDKSFFEWFKNRSQCNAESVYRILSFVR